MKKAEPGFTQTPNALLDIVPFLGDAENRVCLAVLRKTIGWRTDEVELSIPDLMDLTRLSKPAVINGAKAAIDRGILSRRPRKNTFIYKIESSNLSKIYDELVNEVNQSTKVTSKPSEPIYAQNGKGKQPKTVNEVNRSSLDIKKPKETEKKKLTRTTPRDEPWERFKTAHQKHYGAPYVKGGGDFPRYTEFKRDLTEPINLDDWDRALVNFYKSPVKHSFAYFLKIYGECLHGPVNEFGSLVSPVLPLTPLPRAPAMTLGSALMTEDDVIHLSEKWSEIKHGGVHR